MRLHGHPLGFITVDLADGPISSDALAARIQTELASEIESHLALDGLDTSSPVAASGLAVGAACHRSFALESDTPMVSVVVSTFRRSELLSGCLDSLLASDHPNFEILVVDNSPDDPSTRALLQQRYRDDARVRYFAEPTPGLSRARNTGLKYSRGEIVAFTDDDVVVDARWIRTLAATLLSEPAAICVTGLILATELDTPSQALFERFGGFSKGLGRRVFDLAGHEDDSPLYPFTVGLFGAGANMALRKNLIDDLWQFDVNLGAGTAAAGGEDIDCFIDFLFQGHKLVYEPAAMNWHRHSREADEMRMKMRLYGTGLSAMLTKQLVVGSGRRRQLIKRIPHGARYALRAESRHDPRRSSAYPRDLMVQELLGLAIGPFAYLGGRISNAWSSA